MCVGIGAGAYPFLLWLTWGSTSPLTNAGVHDFVGAFVAYIFAGVFSLMLAWKLGPRAGMFKPHPVLGERGAPYNLGLTTVGVALLLFAIPFIVLGCGYFFPDTGYFGIAMTTSGLGVVYNNIFLAYAVGGLVGALIAYRTRNVTHALLGPLAGYIAGTAAFDVVAPWQMMLIALFAPLFTWAVYEWLHARGIDESKVVPLGIGAGIYGAIVVGFAQWHEKTGGFLGIEERTYAFQNAEITPYWQLAGVGTAVGIALVSGLVLVFGLDRIVPLRVRDEEEIKGLDPLYWNVPPAGADIATGDGARAVTAPPAGERVAGS
jgi:ammonia channel protein AmtB